MVSSILLAAAFGQHLQEVKKKAFVTFPQFLMGKRKVPH